MRTPLTAGQCTSLSKNYQTKRGNEMPEKLGIESLEKLAMFGAEFGNVVEDIANKQGVFSLFQLADEAAALSSLKIDQVIAEVKDLSQSEYEQLSAKVKAKLDLADDVIEAKVEAGIDLVAEVIELGVSGVALVSKAKALFEKQAA